MSKKQRYGWKMRLFGLILIPVAFVQISMLWSLPEDFPIFGVLDPSRCWAIFRYGKSLEELDE